MSIEQRRLQYTDHPVWATADSLRQRLLDGPDPGGTAAQIDREYAIDVLANLYEHQSHWNPLIRPQTLESIRAQLNNVEANVQHWINNRNDGNLAEAANQLAAIAQQILSWPPLKDTYFRGILSTSEAFQRDTEAKILEISGKVDGLFDELHAAQSTAESRLVEIDRVRDSFAAYVEEIKTAVSRETQRIDAAVTDVVDRYAAETAERTEKFNSHLEQKDEVFSTFLSARAEKASALIEVLKSLKGEAEELVGAVGLTATATDYGKYAELESKVANKLRIAALVFFSGSFLWLLLGHLVPADQAGDFWQHALVRVVGAVALLGGGLYSARESAQHRRQARLAKAKQLDLKALDPFVATLPEAEKLDIKAKAARRLFVESDAGNVEDSSSGHPLEEALKVIAQLAQNLSKTEGKST